VETYLYIAIAALALNIITFLWLVIVGFKRSIAWGVGVFLFSPLAALMFAFTNWYDAKRSFMLYLISGLAFFASVYLLYEEGLYDRIQKVDMLTKAGQIKEQDIGLYFIDINKPLPDVADAGVDIDGDGFIDPPVAEMAAVDGAETISTKGENTPESTESTITEVVDFDTVDAVKGKPIGKPILTEVDKPTEMVDGMEKKAKGPGKTADGKPSLDYPLPGQATVDPLLAPKKKIESESTRVSLGKVNKFIGRYFIVKTKRGVEHRGVLVKITKSRLILERKIYGGTFRYKISKKRIKRLDMLKDEVS